MAGENRDFFEEIEAIPEESTEPGLLLTGADTIGHATILIPLVSLVEPLNNPMKKPRMDFTYVALFCLLPMEMWALIFMYFGVKDLINIKRVNKYFYENFEILVGRHNKFLQMAKMPNIIITFEGVMEIMSNIRDQMALRYSTIIGGTTVAIDVTCAVEDSYNAKLTYWARVYYILKKWYQRGFIHRCSLECDAYIGRCGLSTAVYSNSYFFENETNSWLTRMLQLGLYNQMLNETPLFNLLDDLFGTEYKQTVRNSILATFALHPDGLWYLNNRSGLFILKRYFPDIVFSYLLEVHTNINQYVWYGGRLCTYEDFLIAYPNSIVTEEQFKRAMERMRTNQNCYDLVACMPGRSYNAMFVMYPDTRDRVSYSG